MNEEDDVIEGQEGGSTSRTSDEDGDEEVNNDVITVSPKDRRDCGEHLHRLALHFAALFCPHCALYCV